MMYVYILCGCTYVLIYVYIYIRLSLSVEFNFAQLHNSLLVINVIVTVVAIIIGEQGPVVVP